MGNYFEVDLMKQLNTEMNRRGQSPMKVEAVQTFVEFKFDKHRDIEFYLVPYIFLIFQSVWKVPNRFSEIHLLAQSHVFQLLAISSEAKKCLSIFSWTTIYGVSFDNFCDWLKIITLISIVIIIGKLVKKKKLARRDPFVVFRICGFTINSDDTLIILITLLLNFLYPFQKRLSYLGIFLSIITAIDLIECGTFFANFRLKGTNVDKTDMIGFGLIILANAYDYKPTSKLPISIAVFYICIGLFDILREWIEVNVRVTPGLKNEIVEDKFEGEVRFEDQFVGDGHIG